MRAPQRRSSASTIAALLVCAGTCLRVGPLSAAPFCTAWLAGPFTGPAPGADAEILAATTWDPDGIGPLPPVVVVGGQFGTIDGVVARNIAYWDGIVWRALGAGVHGEVEALTTHNGLLAVGGRFDAAGNAPARNIALWDGTNWRPMGDGLNLPAGGGEVKTLLSFNSHLFAGGNFLLPNVLYTGHIAEWDGSSWHSMDYGMNSIVRSLAVYNNQIHAAGAFTQAGGTDVHGMAVWDGVSWSDVIGSSTDWPGRLSDNPSILCLASFNGLLFAGGADLGTAPLWKWDGSKWQVAGDMDGTVRVLGAAGGLFYAGGDFNTCPGCPQNSYGIGLYNGSVSSWGGLGTGVGPPNRGVLVEALADYNGTVFAGGVFDVAGGLPSKNVSVWSGARWACPGAPTRVFSFATYGSKVAIGGYFSQPASGGQAYELATWKGNGLSLEDASPDAPVTALYGFSDFSIPSADYLVVGGGFSNVGDVTANHIALRTESTFYPFNTWSPIGAGLNNYVFAIDRLNGNIVAGGMFTNSGSTPVSHVAMFEGSSWQPMGTGMSAPVRAFKTYRTHTANVLVAGGDFTFANGGPANHVAYWTRTFSGSDVPWQPMGGGFDGSVYALESFNGQIYAAGTFTYTGTTLSPVSHIARWNGAAWLPVGSQPGGGLDGPVYSLRVEGGYLYAGGDFAIADGTYAPNLARWDGTSWSAVPGGPLSPIVALTSYNGEVIAGGQLTSITLGTIPSWGLARHSASGIPWVSQQPLGQTVNAGQTATLTMQLANGYFGLLSWRKDYQPLSDGVTASGSTIAGSQTNSLTISNAATSDSGSYDCVVSNKCGGTSSWIANLVVHATTGVPAPAGESPLRVSLRPNPSHGVTRVALGIGGSGEVKVEVLDSAGRLVRLLARGAMGPGQREFEWDGSDSRGRRVASGAYFVRVETSGQSATRRVIVAR